MDKKEKLQKSLEKNLPVSADAQERKDKKDIKDDYELENDSEIFTSGSGGIFRSGIPIGKTIANEEIGLDTIKVKFHSDFPNYVW